MTQELTDLRVLIVDDEQDIRQGLCKLVSKLGPDVTAATNGVDAIRKFERSPFDLVLTDLMMPEMGGAELLSKIKQQAPDTKVVILTGFGTVQTAVTCLQGGAAHFLQKPFDNAEIQRLVRRLGSQIVSARHPRRTGGTVVAKDPRTLQMFALARKVAPTPVPVLIEGESGTGKEVVARAIHEHSELANRPFLAVNAAALTDTLLESELFGHKRGAFTGADRDHAGIFEAAAGGTVFLDEIASMTPAFQGKLLRVLQEKVVRPVGGSKDIAVDFRLIAASNRDLRELVKTEQFREDLYYRLRVVSVFVPPLRERPEDIPHLAEHFLARAASLCLGPGEPEPKLTCEAAATLRNHTWPGNVRELENAMQRAVIVCTGDRILPLDLGLDGDPSAVETVADADADTYEEAKKRSLERFQREFVTRALARSRGNISHAAEACGLSRAAMQRILRQLDIDRAEFA